MANVGSARGMEALVRDSHVLRQSGDVARYPPFCVARRAMPIAGGAVFRCRTLEWVVGNIPQKNQHDQSALRDELPKLNDSG